MIEDLTKLLQHAKPGSALSPLDAVEMLTLAQHNDTQGVLAIAIPLLDKDIPTDAKRLLETITGQQATNDPARRMEAAIRNVLGTTGMAYPDPTPEPEVEDEDAGMIIDFGDDADEAPKEPSAMAKLAQAISVSLSQAGMRSGQASVLGPVGSLLEKAVETRSLTPLVTMFSKHGRELGMMVPYVAMDDTLEKALDDLLPVLPFAQTLKDALIAARDQISASVQPNTVFAALALHLLIEKARLDENS